jgi:hypothetical protein
MSVPGISGEATARGVECVAMGSSECSERALSCLYPHVPNEHILLSRLQAYSCQIRTYSSGAGRCRFSLE